MTRFRLALLLSCLLLWSSGCAGCKDPCADVTCAVGEACVDGVCEAPGSGGCDPACADTEVCQSGNCVPLDVQCSQFAAECDPSLPVVDGAFCVDLDGPGPRPGVCMQSCGPNADCPSGALCFYLAGPDDAACSSTDECAEGEECADGACRATICRPSECDGFLEGGAVCNQLYQGVSAFASGAHCYDVGNGASYCYPAGNSGEGGACGDLVTAINTGDFSATCQMGLACADGICRRACGVDDDCSGDDECLLEEEGIVSDGVGLCGLGCTPFSTGECGSGMACLPISESDGVCVQAGSSQAFEACSPGDAACVDGTVCVGFATGVGRCLPICNVGAGPANDDGSVGDFAQTQRDATCPQSDPVGGWIEILNFAELGTPVDVYIDDEMSPTIPALALDGRSDADRAAPGSQFIELDTGSHTLKVLTAGAPRTDAPLVERTITLAAEQAVTAFLIPVYNASDELVIVTVDTPRNAPTASAGQSYTRVLHALVDQAELDFVVVPPGDDLSDPAAQTELAVGMQVGALGDWVDVGVGDFDLLAFAAGSARTDRAQALFETRITTTDITVATLALRGSVDPDDTLGTAATFAPHVAPPELGGGGPRYMCVDLGSEAFGACQQRCGARSEGFGSGACLGASMGCGPTLHAVTASWELLCAPHGQAELGEACDPFAGITGCGEGAHCLEYGDARPEFDAALRGVCTPLCLVDDPDDATLRCDAGQACQPYSYTSDFAVGRCGYTCDPDERYADATCPAGLGSCKPFASLQDDLSATGSMLPLVSDEAPFCSASGTLPEGEPCAGNDCEPGTECMYPRSQQTDFVATLVSQYFGAAGSVPTCVPQCDPFDHDGTAHQCTTGETCLFNFPWSAEVGHCAQVAEDKRPLEGCSSPGLACGDDSICVMDGGEGVCFQFCQYAGPGADGLLRQEGCDAGLECNPLVADIGVCLPPG